MDYGGMWTLCLHRSEALGLMRLRASTSATYPTWLSCRPVRRPTKRNGATSRLGLDWPIRYRKASAGRPCFEEGLESFMILRLQTGETMSTASTTLLDHLNLAPSP